MKQKSTGLIFVYTGDGKGKTTAAVGAAVRAAGQGMRVLIIQFMKGQPGIGIKKGLARCHLPITLLQFGREGFVHSRACETIDIYLAYQGLKAFQNAMETGTYHMIILDEINVAIDYGLLDLEDVLEIVQNKSSGLHLILTGRNAKEPLCAMADLVTEMREIKHHYQRGVSAQIGIEM